MPESGAIFADLFPSGFLKPNEPVVAQAVFLGNINPVEPAGGNFSTISWVTGSDSSFGGFYGTSYQGFGGIANGGVVEIQSDQSAASGEWWIEGAGFRSPPGEPAPHGTRQISGFVAGMAENMTAPDQDPRLFLNQEASFLNIEMDRAPCGWRENPRCRRPWTISFNRDTWATMRARRWAF